MKKSIDTPVPPYRYERITTRSLLKDIAGFHGGPTPGEAFPEFDLLTTDGKRVRQDDFIGRPLLLTVGSLTCPMTASAAAPLKRLYEDYGRDVSFLTVYVREAHPGEIIGQARDRDEKLNYAHVLQQRDAIYWPVAIDSLEGDLHLQLGGRTSGAYLIDKDGNVAFRALWAADEAGLRKAMGRLTQGLPLARRESRRRVVAMLGGIGCMSQTLADAGKDARKQLFRKAPPFYALGRVAGFFKPLPPVARGVVSILVTALGAAYLTKIATRGRGVR